MPFSPLGRGFLTGTIDASATFAKGDIRGRLPRFSSEAREVNAGLLDVVREVAGRTDSTPAQVALAWILAQRPWIVPIPGTRSAERLAENSAASELDLTPDEVQQITAASASFDVQGDRYTEAMSKYIED